MPDLTLLHTAEVHCATFHSLAPKANLHQVVREDWLARAQNGIDAMLAAEIAEAAGATRVDWPMT